MNSNLHIVTKREIHWLPDCPCSQCVIERERRAVRTNREPTHNPVKTVPVAVAFLLGFIPSRSPCGSVARELAIKRNQTNPV